MKALTRVVCPDLPLEVIESLHALMVACVEEWPDPRDAPEPIRKALGHAVETWLQSVDVDEEEGDGA